MNPDAGSLAVTPTYHLAVSYRIYPAVSLTARSLPMGDDKLRLTEAGLRSFRESLGPLRVRLWAILYGCPAAYREMVLRCFDGAGGADVEVVELEGRGNQATFDAQIDLLLAQDDAPFIYFAEDDYFYLPGRFPRLLEFLAAHENVDFVSPYDHPDSYTDALHRYPSWIRPPRRAALADGGVYVPHVPDAQEHAGEGRAVVPQQRPGQLGLHALAEADHLAEPFLAPGTDWRALLADAAERMAAAAPAGA